LLWGDLDLAFNPDSVRVTLNRAAERAGLGVTGFHILRHSGITLMLERGWAVHTATAIAGHSRASMTLDVYSHALPDRLPEHPGWSADPQPPLRAVGDAE
jgi:integrase